MQAVLTLPCEPCCVQAVDARAAAEAFSVQATAAREEAAEARAAVEDMRRRLLEAAEAHEAELAAARAAAEAAMVQVGAGLMHSCFLVWARLLQFVAPWRPFGLRQSCLLA